MLDRRLLWTGAFAAIAGCSAGAGDDLGNGGATTTGTKTSTSGMPTSSVTEATGNTQTTGTGFGDQSATATGAGGSCAAVSAEAEPTVQPADIIIAVDTSGSMDEETAWVQQNLNDFATIITQSGIDAHVILIADPSVCIPAPLGAGACPGADENLPAYRHVPQTVQSTDALSLFISTYPQWQAQLRPGASKTFLVVTDDDSQISAGDFTNQLLALDPPTFQGFKFDGIIATSNPLACFGFQCPVGNPCCYNPIPFVCDSYAAEEGTVYKDLIAQTMGVQGDLCLQDFGPVFQDIATAVVQSSTIACDFAIPPPPMGEALDFAKVNLNYAPGGQNPAPVLNVPGGQADCTAAGGWYYDDPASPTRIFLCPATCAAVQADTAAKIDVLFGCDTEIVPA